jgi:hypothetical protein
VFRIKRDRAKVLGGTPPGQLRRCAARNAVWNRHTFLLCFLISVLPFVAINLAMVIVASRCCDYDGYAVAGFPLHFYFTGWTPQSFLWSTFIADVAVAVVAGLISAKILKNVFHPSG